MLASKEQRVALLCRRERAVTVRAARNQFARFVVGEFAKRQVGKDIEEGGSVAKCFREVNQRRFGRRVMNAIACWLIKYRQES